MVGELTEFFLDFRMLGCVTFVRPVGFTVTSLTPDSLD